jgi:hypothetical protein
MFIHNTPTRTNQTRTKREGRTPRTRHSRFILMLATYNVHSFSAQEGAARGIEMACGREKQTSEAGWVAEP